MAIFLVLVRYLPRIGCGVRNGGVPQGVPCIAIAPILVLPESFAVLLGTLGVIMKPKHSKQLKRLRPNLMNAGFALSLNIFTTTGLPNASWKTTAMARMGRTVIAGRNGRTTNDAEKYLRLAASPCPRPGALGDSVGLHKHALAPARGVLQAQRAGVAGADDKKICNG
jgi:hypothetical protein